MTLSDLERRDAWGPIFPVDLHLTESGQIQYSNMWGRDMFLEGQARPMS